jgi:hypothetical protein
MEPHPQVFVENCGLTAMHYSTDRVRCFQAAVSRPAPGEGAGMEKDDALLYSVVELKNADPKNFR